MRRLVTLLASLACVAGFAGPLATTTQAAVDSGSGPSAGAAASAPVVSAVSSTVLLPTGEQVVARGTGDRTTYGVLPARTSGPAAVLREWRTTDGTYFAPVTALPYLGTLLDPALFEVSRPAPSASGSPATLSLAIRHTGPTPTIPGVTVTSDHGGEAQGTMTAASAKAFGAALAKRWAVDGGTRSTASLFGGVSHIAPASGGTQPPVAPHFQMYTLVIKGIAADGGKLPFASGLIMNVDDGRKYLGFIGLKGGEARVSVPAGTYSGSFAAFLGTTAVILPIGEVSVRGPSTTVTVDVRKATIHPGVSVPRPTAPQSSIAVYQYARTDALERNTIENGVLLAGGETTLRVAPVGRATVGRQAFLSSYRLESARGDYTYDLAYSSDRITPGEDRTVTPSQLATSIEKHDTDTRHSVAYFDREPVAPNAFFASGLSVLSPIAVPLTRTAYVASDYTDTFAEEEDSGSFPGSDDTGRLTGTQRYTPGSATTVTWRRGPLGAAVTRPTGPYAVCTACRSSRGLDLYLAPYSDTSGHAGDLVTSLTGAPTTHATLRRGSSLLLDQDNVSGGIGVRVPDGAADYTFALDTDRYGQDPELSTRSHTELGFRSAATTGPAAPSGWACLSGKDCRVLPILQGRAFVPTDSVGSLTPGRSTITVELGRIAGAAPAGVTKAVLSLRPAGFGPATFPLVAAGGGRYRATVDLPDSLSGAKVDLGIEAADSGGSTFSQTVERAFLIGSAASPSGRAASSSAASGGAPATWARAACGTPARGTFTCFARWTPGPAAAASATVGPGLPSSGLRPADIVSAYHLDTSTGQGQTVAIVLWYDDPKVESDLAVYRKAFGLAPCTTANGCFRKIDQRGGTHYPVADAGSAVETHLDTQAVSASCPRCKILLVEADAPTFKDVGEAVNQAVKQGATIVNNSYGAPEFTGNRLVGRDYYTHDGVSIVVSTGDSGFSAASFPANLKSSIAVGGTALSKTGAGAWTERASVIGNSGCSAYVAKPSWQKDAHCLMRTTSDVSAAGENFAVYDSFGLGRSNGWIVVDGTSISSPLVAGMIGLAGNATAMGSAERIYQHPGQLHDVVGGSNGYCGGDYLCTALKGYDAPTGNGSPRGVGAL